MRCDMFVYDLHILSVLSHVLESSTAGDEKSLFLNQDA